VTTGKVRASLKGHHNTVKSLAFSADGKLLVSGSRDHTIKLWDAQGGTEMATLEGHTREMYTIALTPNGKFLISGGEDRTIRLWDIGGRKEAVVWREDAPVWTVAISPDGRRVVVGVGSVIKVWDIEMLIGPGKKR
jgi:WD40 repeat protein